MAFIDFIEKLQKKPRQTRVKIMWVTVTICMAFIFVVWFWSLSNEMQTSALQPKAADSLAGLDQMKQDLPSLWQSLGAGISGIFQSVKDNINSLQSATTTPMSASLESTSPTGTPSEEPSALPNSVERLPIE